MIVLKINPGKINTYTAKESKQTLLQNWIPPSCRTETKGGDKTTRHKGWKEIKERKYSRIKGKADIILLVMD
jgi:hypothetical protein